MLISEIFQSIQGESSYAGLPTVFVRTQVCNLRCWWCDSTYTFDPKDGKEMSVDEIYDEVKKYPAQYVCLTGGEPLIWGHELEDLISALSNKYNHITIETGGGVDISTFNRRLAKYILDIKCPSSHMQELCKHSNIEHLTFGDEIKFVISNWADYQYAGQVLLDEQVVVNGKWWAVIDWCEAMGIKILFSPVFGELEPGELADRVLDDGLPVRVQVQMHKILWPEKSRGY